jgi:hypothetical protein
VGLVNTLSCTSEVQLGQLIAFLLRWEVHTVTAPRWRNHQFPVLAICHILPIYRPALVSWLRWNYRWREDHGSWIGKDLEVGGHDIFQVRLLPSYLLGGNEASHENIIRYIQLSR